MELEVAAAFEGAENLVDALTRASDHRSEVGLGHVEVEFHGVIERPPAFVPQRDEKFGDAAVEVQEHEVGGLLGEPAARP